MNHTAPTPAQHLATVARHWNDLRDMLTAAQADTWPPAMGLDYLAALDQADADEIRAARAAEHAARSADSLGERPVPLRLTVLDTMRTVQAALVELADQTAASVQRPAIGMPTGDLAGWTMANITRRAELVREDRADLRRWRYTGERTAPQAAEWLSARLKGEPGPFRPLNEKHRNHIATVAEEAARRVEKALDMARTKRPLDRPCPRCGGQLTMHTGGTDEPEVSCGECGWDWAGPELASLLAQLEHTPAPA